VAFLAGAIGDSKLADGLYRSGSSAALAARSLLKKGAVGRAVVDVVESDV
jgi:hypothetical protein